MKGVFVNCVAPILATLPYTVALRWMSVTEGIGHSMTSVSDAVSAKYNTLSDSIT